MPKNKSKPNWDKIKAEYITNKKSSLRKIAEKYNISFATVKARCKREGWASLKEQSQKEIVQELPQKVAQKMADKISDKIVEVNKQHLELCEEGRELIEFYIEELKESAQQRKDKNLKKSKLSAYALDYLFSAIKKLQQVERTANGMDLKPSEREANKITEPEMIFIKNLDIDKI